MRGVGREGPAERLAEFLALALFWGCAGSLPSLFPTKADHYMLNPKAQHYAVAGPNRPPCPALVCLNLPICGPGSPELPPLARGPCLSCCSLFSVVEATCAGCFSSPETILTSANKMQVVREAKPGVLRESYVLTG